MFPTDSFCTCTLDLCSGCSLKPDLLMVASFLSVSYQFQCHLFRGVIPDLPDEGLPALSHSVAACTQSGHLNTLRKIHQDQGDLYSELLWKHWNNWVTKKGEISSPNISNWRSFTTLGLEGKGSWAYAGSLRLGFWGCCRTCHCYRRNHCHTSAWKMGATQCDPEEPEPRSQHHVGLAGGQHPTSRHHPTSCHHFHLFLPSSFLMKGQLTRGSGDSLQASSPPETQRRVWRARGGLTVYSQVTSPICASDRIPTLYIYSHFHANTAKKLMFMTIPCKNEGILPPQNRIISIFRPHESLLVQSWSNLDILWHEAGSYTLWKSSGQRNNS